MAVIDDMIKKTKEWGKTVIIHAPTENLTCRICGKTYFSRGKNDPGICRECEKEQNATLIGGPLDGEKAKK